MRICSDENNEFHDVVSNKDTLIERFKTLEEAQNYIECCYADEESEQFFDVGNLDPLDVSPITSTFINKLYRNVINNTKGTKFILAKSRW